MDYNVEQFYDDLETFLKANLNTKIASINTAYGNAPVLDTISNNAYYFQTLNNSVVNYPQFIYIDTDNPTIDDAQRGSIVETYRFTVLICFSDKADGSSTGKKLARYSRCLKELFLSNLKIGRKQVVISGLESAGFAQLNNSDVVRTTGVTIEVEFGK